MATITAQERHAAITWNTQSHFDTSCARPLRACAAITTFDTQLNLAASLGGVTATLGEWPGEQNGKSLVAAKQALIDAHESKSSTEEERRAFLAAAEEAQILFFRA
ncbi:DUF982 domain-containing protein [Rhizobium jaguaris]|uniref:DUF982 domain-containing protein n=2 Tax=Rhizobium jaguaris TaxID=1312183 RepID=A0A387FLH8_9HYPH|nr:DUF982 domain-containing protein [Rhizobium jaguaris]